MGAYRYSEEDISKIGAWLKEGLTATQIAGLMSKARGAEISRLSICGIIFRTPQLKDGERNRKHFTPSVKRSPRHLADVRPTPKIERPAKTTESMLRPPAIRQKPDPELKIVTSAEARTYDAASRQLPLAELGRHECRFPVNDAAKGELHLFCAAAVRPERRYCDHHQGRMYR